MTFPPRHIPKSSDGFSLVEIVLAIGITSFALIATLGLLPVGLNSLQESTIQTAAANIANQLRGELQQISFNTNSSFNVHTLASTPYYFTKEGTKGNENNCYFEATFDPTDGLVGGASFEVSNAQNIRVSLSYPHGVPEANRKTLSFSLFAARQSAQ